MRFHKTSGLLLALALVSGCAQNDEEILEGQRYDIRGPVPTLGDAAPATSEDIAVITRFRMPRATNNQSWTHRGGSSRHSVKHPALATDLTQQWAVSIGQGNSRRARITADPIVAQGRIFTMDSASRVAAFDTQGAQLWARELVPPAEKSTDATGGGLAYGNGVVIASTGFGELVALHAESGEIIWRQRLDAPVTAAPTIANGLIYVVSRDNRAWALDAGTGRIKWQLSGTPTQTVMVGGAGPVVTNRLVIFPFGSGEMTAALKRSGIQVWGASVAGQRRGQAYAGISDITSDPVVVGNRVYAANQGGRMVAFQAASGKRIWSANEGSYSPVFPAGNSVFLISDQARLIRLDDRTGERIWAKQLPYFVDEQVKRHKGVTAHFGPVLAGGRLIVVSGDGKMRSFDPETGALLDTTALPGGAASNPVIVDNTLYVITATGKLTAFR